MKEVLWCFAYIKEKTLGENCKEAYKLCRESNPKTRINIDTKALLNLKNFILKAKSITAVETDEKQRREDMHTDRCGNTRRQKCHAKEI
jgi:hypothetical protein